MNINYKDSMHCKMSNFDLFPGLKYQYIYMISLFKCCFFMHIIMITLHNIILVHTTFRNLFFAGGGGKMHEDGQREVT